MATGMDGKSYWQWPQHSPCPSLCPDALIKCETKGRTTPPVDLENIPMKIQSLLLFTLIALLLGLGACTRQPVFNGTVFDDPQPAADFVGTNYDGNTFRLSDHKGKVVVVFFGYTFCPDVCPMTLAEMKSVYEGLGEEAEDLSVVLVTVDPERDTLEKLAGYVPLFSSDFYGVRIEGEELTRVKTAYGVYAEKNLQGKDGATDKYLVDHTGGIYVIDKAGNLRGLLKHDTGAENMLSDIRYFVREG
jgi:protein SCO1/2